MIVCEVVCSDERAWARLSLKVDMTDSSLYSVPGTVRNDTRHRYASKGLQTRTKKTNESAVKRSIKYLRTAFHTVKVSTCVTVVYRRLRRNSCRSREWRRWCERQLRRCTRSEDRAAKKVPKSNPSGDASTPISAVLLSRFLTRKSMASCIV